MSKLFWLCKWIHEKLELLPLIQYPFELNSLPKNGIYFFYEKGEYWGHGGNKNRIVRIGTHKKENFRTRINDHYNLNSLEINFSVNDSKPSDRSIFRKNIGRALLNDKHDKYIKIWEISFMEKKNKEKFSQLRDIQKEILLEQRISEILRNNFSFKYIIIENEEKRIGSKGLERALIGTVARCYLCRPSSNWLGKKSPIREISRGKLWEVQHLKNYDITNEDKISIIRAIKKTKEFIRSNS